MRSVPISHSITGPLARSIGLGCTGAEREKALTNAGGLSGPPLGVHYRQHELNMVAHPVNAIYNTHFLIQESRLHRWPQSSKEQRTKGVEGRHGTSPIKTAPARGVPSRDLQTRTQRSRWLRNSRSKHAYAG